MVLSMRADDLNAERKAIFAKSGRERHRRHAKKSPRRTIFRIAGIAQAFRRLAEGRQRQYSVECEAGTALCGRERLRSKLGL